MKTSSAFKNPRLLKALTGVSKEEFTALLPLFEQCALEDKHKRSKAKKRQFGGGSKGKLPIAESKLFFILVYIKTYPTFDFMGFLFGMHRSKAHKKHRPSVWSSREGIRETVGYA